MIRKFLMAVVLMVSVTAGAWAQEKDTTKVPEKTKAFSLACDLVQYGYANNSATSLIEAAKIIKENGFSVGDITKYNPTEEKGEQNLKVVEKSKSAAKITLDATELLADAKKLAAGDKTLLAMVDNVSKSSTRGGYYYYYEEDLSAYTTKTWDHWCPSNSKNYVTVRGDGDTKLRVQVYDSHWNYIYGLTDYQVMIWWTATMGQTYHIKIYNTSSPYNHYRVWFER